MIDLKLLEKTGLTPDEYIYLYKLYTSDVTPVKVRVDIESLKKNTYIDENQLLLEKGVLLFTSEKDVIENWIEDWRQLFPNIKASHGNVRGDRQGCIKKMKSFIKKYPEFTKDIIFKGTLGYIQAKKRDGYQYMKLAHYFIEKDGISDLASYCEQVGDIDTQSDERINVI